MYVTFPSQSANSGLPLLCAAHRSHSGGPSVRERERVRPSLLLLPSPLSLSLPTLLHYQPLPHYLPIQLRYCIYPLPPKLTISRFCWPRSSTQPPPPFFPPFFSTLNGLDSVILSSSMLFFHSRDRDCSHGRATSHLCLLEHHR